jgi:hypothetical protein
MEEWKARYEHLRDMQYAQCESIGVPIPKETYGSLRVMPELNRRFNAKTFWPAFKKRGHDSAVFEKCECHKPR